MPHDASNLDAMVVSRATTSVTQPPRSRIASLIAGAGVKIYPALVLRRPSASRTAEHGRHFMMDLPGEVRATALRTEIHPVIAIMTESHMTESQRPTLV